MKTNRKHFSWSQYDLWRRSKREYWKRYSLGVEAKTNRFFDKGKELANFIESGISAERDPMLRLVVDRLPKLGVAEEEIRFETINGNEVLCFLDLSSGDGTEFVEIKTGKVPWTQEMVDNHDQMLFYALGSFLKHKRLPASRLIWVETMETKDDGLLYTGDIHIFERFYTFTEIEDFTKKIDKVIDEISEYDYQELELNNEEIDRYVHLQNVIEEATNELSEIKMKIHAEMAMADVTFGKGNKGNFIISTKKTWKYSEVIDELKKDIKLQQTAEQKSETATFTTKQSIMFKLNK